MKICPRCERELPLEAFGKHRGHKDGHQSHCKKCKAKTDKEYSDRNKNQKYQYDKKRRQAESQENRDKRNERRRELHASNPKTRSKHNKQWKQSHPEKVRLQRQRRRAMLKNAQGHFSEADWEDVKSMFDNLCAYCGFPKPLTMDHIIPLSKGGRHDKSNIVPACISCNSQKHASVGEWPIMTQKANVIEFYRGTLDNAFQMFLDFAEGVS